MENKLNIDNLRTFVQALNKLPDDIKNNQVDMVSTDEPMCGTAGCHAGLISMVDDYIPELNYIPELEYLYHQSDYVYDYFAWTNTLGKFLGFNSEYDLRKWAAKNPNLWGNEDGFDMFAKGYAFGQKTNKFKHSVIIDYWTGVLHRVEESNK